ncbi:MAG TPA: hypothetical protein VM681_04505 [Candidatus Thermoplasmatota archaeon]|nr:hypothetical protein [Candidatus Thermoplasmatota archaeon]
MRALLVLALLLAPLAGCLSGGGGSLSVAASAPRTADHLQIQALLTGGSPYTGEGTFVVRSGARQVFPVAGEARISFVDGSAVTTVPYREFVTQNGQYTVVVSARGATGQASTDVLKVIDSLRVIARYDADDRELSIDVNFLAGAAGPPQTPVLTTGNATIEVFNASREARYTRTVAVDEPSFGFADTVAREAFFQGEGDYKVQVTFVNAHARGNTVANDPFFRADVANVR